MIAGSVVVGALTLCALIHLMCDLKVAQMNIQNSLIQEFILYKFELGHKTVEETKNICCVKGDGAFDHRTEILFRLQEP